MKNLGWCRLNRGPPLPRPFDSLRVTSCGRLLVQSWGGLMGEGSVSQVSDLAVRIRENVSTDDRRQGRGDQSGPGRAALSRSHPGRGRAWHRQDNSGEGSGPVPWMHLQADSGHPRPDAGGMSWALTTSIRRHPSSSFVPGPYSARWSLPMRSTGRPLALSRHSSKPCRSDRPRWTASRCLFPSRFW